MLLALVWRSALSVLLFTELQPVSNGLLIPWAFRPCARESMTSPGATKIRMHPTAQGYSRSGARLLRLSAADRMSSVLTGKAPSIERGADFWDGGEHTHFKSFGFGASGFFRHSDFDIWVYEMSTWLIGTICSLLVAGSDFAPREQVILFNTWAWRDAAAGEWVIPIHGWIFEDEPDSLTRKALLKVLEESLELDEAPAARQAFQTNARWFLVDNERDRRLKIRIGEKDYPAGPSTPNGHFHAEVRLKPEAVSRLSRVDLSGRRWLDYSVAGSGEPPKFTGTVELLADGGLTVISDIDDTIRVTGVGSKRRMILRTFLQPWKAVTGVSALYRRWAEAGASFRYVSSSPWQLYPLLTAFLESEGFPIATFDLNLFRPKDRTLFDAFADPEETKRAKIEPLLERFPGRQFVLIGDSGEKDPEVYGTLARKYPDRVKWVFIRKVTPAGANDPRYGRAFEGVARERWRLFKDPRELYGLISRSPATTRAE